MRDSSGRERGTRCRRLPSRRSRLRSCAGAIGSALLLVLLFGVLLGGCSRGDGHTVAAPETAYRAFLDAVRSRDGDAVHAFLEDRVRDDLAARAERWRAATGKELSPPEFLMMAWGPGEADVERIEREATEGGTTTLRVETALGESYRVSLRREAGEWRVVVPGPWDASR